MAAILFGLLGKETPIVALPLIAAVTYSRSKAQDIRISRVETIAGGVLLLGWALAVWYLGPWQSELAEVITGLRPCTGSILVNGAEVSNEAPIIAIKRGVSHIPEDRTKVGTAPNMTITENSIMKNYSKSPIGSWWSINFSSARNFARELKSKYDILAPSVRTMARKLSGGNLQKVILAREISAEPKLMVAVQPTRGLDVGAIESVQRMLLEQRDRGTAVLLISEELEELLTLSDRIAVIYEGEIMGMVEAENADVNEIGLMMTGTRQENIKIHQGSNAS